jgi:hypothetical protein
MLCTGLMSALPLEAFTATIAAWAFECHETLLLRSLEFAFFRMRDMRVTSCRLRRVILWIKSPFLMLRHLN